MSRAKQIEEMARTIGEKRMACSRDDCKKCSSHEQCLYQDIAWGLYSAGYRKQNKGEWLLIKVPTGVELYGIREVQAYPKCSVCGYMGDVSEWHFKYCSNCGAKMKGGAE